MTTHFGQRAPRIARFFQIAALISLLATTVSSAHASECVPTSSAGPKWGWPMATHALLSRFDKPAQNWLPGHRGVDIIGNALDPIFSAGAGTVSFAGLVAGKSVVVINHGKLRTTYEPVLPTVIVGQHVSRGQVIGVLTPGASHCSPFGKVICLHWGLRRGKDYLNPLALMTHIRLLPTGGN